MLINLPNPGRAPPSKTAPRMTVTTNALYNFDARRLGLVLHALQIFGINERLIWAIGLSAGDVIVQPLPATAGIRAVMPLGRASSYFFGV